MIERDDLALEGLELPPEEDAVSIDAVIALRESFAKESPAVGALFDALVDLLTGNGQKH